MEPKTLFQRILVAVDAKGYALNAFEQALALAKVLESRLVAVHASETHSAMWMGLNEKQISAIMDSNLATSRAEVIASLSLQDRAHEFDIASDKDLLRVVPGYSSKAILQIAEKTQAELLVLGAHSRRALFDLGSTTRSILSHTSLPVWRQVGDPQPIRTIMVAVDFSEQSKLALRYAHALAARLGANLRLLHSYEAPAYAFTAEIEDESGAKHVLEQERTVAVNRLAEWMEDFEWGAVQASSTFVDGEARSCIITEGESSDLIVLGTHGRTGLSRFLVGSVAQAVLEKSQKPVLVVPDPDRKWELE